MLAALSGFQYLKGAIGSLLHWPCKVILRIFQYLKGAIGSPYAQHATLVKILFQYFKGAIGRSNQPGKADEMQDFNTSKVRLEAVDSSMR